MITIEEKLSEATVVLIELSSGDNPLNDDENRKLSIAISCARKMKMALEKIIKNSSDPIIKDIAKKALIAQV